MQSLRGVLRFLFEMGQLRAVSRAGWEHIHIGSPVEHVSDHTARTGQLAFILAVLEGHENPYYVATLGLFHDISETRTGDIDKIATRYIQADHSAAVKEQTLEMGDCGQMINQMWHEVETRQTKAGIIAKDADALEMALMARELVVQGNHEAQAWIDAVEKLLKTESAKRLFELLKIADPHQWWKDVYYNKGKR